MYDEGLAFRYVFSDKNNITLYKYILNYKIKLLN